MDQSQGNSQKESLVSLLTLPTELLVHIISFLSSLRDRVKLRYVSRWLRCVIEGTPSLWKEFVWPYCGSHEEYSVKEVLKVCGQHVKVLSFPNSRVSPILEEILQYCSNVQHLSLPLIKFYSEQLRKTIPHMKCLQTLELTVDNDYDIKQLIIGTTQLRELVVIDHRSCDYLELFKHWENSGFRPSKFKLISAGQFASFGALVDYATQLTNLPLGTTAIFRVDEKCIKASSFSPSFPCFQLHVEGSGKVTIPFMKLSDFGILGLENDLVLMTDCQYSGRTMYKVSCHLEQYILNKITSSIHITKLCGPVCATDFDLSCCYSLHSGHLEQIAIACPNLQRLNLNQCYGSLKSVQGLQAIADHCECLQGLHIGQVCISKIEGQILLWEILSDMKLTHLTMDYCVLRCETVNQKALICLYQKCCTIRGIQCDDCYDYHCKSSANKDALILSYFPSLDYCNLHYRNEPAMVHDVINHCKELKCVRYTGCYSTSPDLVHNRNLQQLYIQESHTIVSDEFMISVSAHGGLVHVVMMVQSLTAKGITSLVRNSPKLITLYLSAKTIHCLSVENFKTTLKKMFCKRRLFRAGHYICDRCPRNLNIRLWEQGADLLPLWN